MRMEIEIPEDRVGVLIGKDGEIKKIIEQKCNCKLSFGKNTVIVDYEDTLSFMKAKNVILAIARGFSADIAMKLLDDENLVFESIDLSQLVSEKAIKRILGRIIGKEGKIKKQIEDLLNVNISIYDKYVSIIGEFENLSIAREAINMLIEGSQHSTVLKFVERRRRDLKARSLDWV
ncbi:MAG: RNA-processing protein [Archaeoglobi archaeon]|jgi:ribosomal RNA assembly protein|nr:RNA-processing protein [Archaeoglobales archaeon]TDA26605.1 MAG: RNA-processing protein [Archaeoglobi archaeon]